jgi:saccharopine dehydrogenase-like NADP-dependent oxidoreductase
MRIAIVGAAGTQAQGVIRDLCTSPGVTEVVLVDLEKSKDVLASRQHAWGEGKASIRIADAADPTSLRAAIRGAKVTANCVGHDFNLRVMEACLAEGSHYLDTGGLFHVCRKQMQLDLQWKQAGLTAILGMGSAPGIVSVMAGYCGHYLDTVEYIYLRDGIANYAKSDFPITIPYAPQTLLQEFTDPAYIFENGEWQEVPPFSLGETIDFPQPVGTMTVYPTLHSEVATVPVSFKAKGIKHMSFKLGLPADFEQKMRFLAGIGFGATTPLCVKGAKIAPRDYFVALAETFPKPTGKPADYKCLRVDARGTKSGDDIEMRLEMMCSPCEAWNMKTGPYSVGVPVGITARMLGTGIITERGCVAPELGVPAETFFTFCGKRDMHTKVIIAKPLA